MTQILILLAMALQLLIAAHQPNMPQSVKDTAISVAHTAISVANKAIVEAKEPILGAQTTPISVIASPTPIMPIALQPAPTPTSTSLYDPDYYVWEIITPNPIKVMPEEKKEIKGELLLSAKLVQTAEVALAINGKDNDAPYGVYFINATVTGEGAERNDAKLADGSMVIEYIVTMDAPDQSPHSLNPDIRQVSKQGTWVNDPNGTWNNNFSYRPQTAGKKIITFISGTLTKTIELDVK